MMEKVDLGSQGFIYPMPVTLFGADLESGPNFKPVAWVTRVQPNPPRLAAGLNKSHATTGAIRRHGEPGPRSGSSVTASPTCASCAPSP